jgi:hypothetical protein
MQKNTFNKRVMKGFNWRVLSGYNRVKIGYSFLQCVIGIRWSSTYVHTAPRRSKTWLTAERGK